MTGGAASAMDVRRYGTGLLSTEVRPLDEGGYLWRRKPGPSAPGPFPPVPAPSVKAIAGLPQDGPGRWVLGREQGRAREYRVGGGTSVADRVLREGPGKGLDDVLRAVGGLLAQLHGLPRRSADDQVAGSAGMFRLAVWWSGRGAKDRAKVAGELLRTELGDDGWRLLRGWLAEALADSGSAVVSHGAPTLGSVVCAGPGRPVEFLVGENFCVAPWYADLGWLVGEIVELSWHHGSDHAAWQSALNALFEGYGRDLGARWNRAAALRIALHLHDYSAYVALNPNEVRRYASFLTHLITL
ncbi:hypothetical protein [Streptomyces griseoruber]|uniref:hypothetical protein n=1 Tax=Streptomyces griseoruber TaxID=1943 RepID=UPI00378C5385